MDLKAVPRLFRGKVKFQKLNAQGMTYKTTVFSLRVT
jgi:hypothetical protein